MSRNMLKTIAALAMLADHFGAIFLSIRSPWYVPCRVFGRLTAPIMCYFIAEGFYYTASRKKYLLRMAVFALLAQPAYSLAFHKHIWSWDMNMIFTMLLCVLMLTAWEEIESGTLRWLCVLFLIGLSYYSDWMVVGPIWVLVCWLLRGQKKRQLLAMAAAALVFTLCVVLRDFSGGYRWRYELIQLGTLLALPLLALYNGKKGKGGAFGKWFFYALYPTHLYLYAALKLLR